MIDSHSYIHSIRKIQSILKYFQQYEFQKLRFITVHTRGAIYFTQFLTKRHKFRQLTSSNYINMLKDLQKNISQY